MAGRPQLSSRKGPTYALAEFMNDNWERLVGRTNEDVAQSLGYRTANIISMFRTGKTRIPLEKLPEVAQLMKLDLAVLLPLWFEQYWGDRPDAKQVIKAFAGRVISENEAAMMDQLREGLKGRPNLRPTADQLKLMGLVLADDDVFQAALAAAQKKGLA